MNKERRFLSRPVALRVAEPNEPPGITGYAAVFYKDGDASTEYNFDGFFSDFVERIMPGAFTRAIREDDVCGLFNHDHNYLLGRKVAETLSLAEDDTGLLYEIALPDTSTGKDIYESVKRGDLRGSSFAFIPTKVTWIDGDDDTPSIREVHECQLFDVGPVVYPAYEATTVGVRSAADCEALRVELEGRRRRKLESFLERVRLRARAVEVS